MGKRKLGRASVPRHLLSCMQRELNSEMEVNLASNVLLKSCGVKWFVL